MSSQELTDHDVTSVSKRLTMLEMKELNERQRAEHAVRMYDQQKTQLRQLEDRNFELENKFSEVKKLCFLIRGFNFKFGGSPFSYLRSVSQCTVKTSDTAEVCNL